jgi:geranylgeranyl pyrophosphate synthase
MRIIDGKTASLMAACCVMGGHLAEADQETVELLGRYGRHIGLAFQMVDDVLDFWGDPAALGKPVGSDLSERKFTLPFLLALERADASGRQRLRELVTGSPLPRAHLDEIVALMQALGAREDSLALARQHGQRALQELARLPAGTAREALASLPEALALRDR